MVNIIKRRNSTTLDEKGLKYSLIRGRNESLEDFFSRIIKADSNKEHHKFKIERSFEYATPMQGFEVFKITKNLIEEEVLFEIRDTRITIEVNGELVYNQKLSEVKFLKDLKADLDLIPNINVEVITKKEWEYLRTKNLIQCNSQRTRIEFELEGEVNTLPNKDVRNVQDYLGYFIEDVIEEDSLVNPNQYAIVEGNVLHKHSQRLERVFYDYEDFPLYISYSPIKCYKINKDNFDDILKERLKNEEAFGLIDDDTVVDNNETFEVLSQHGAKIVNKILMKHNTYWGE